MAESDGQSTGAVVPRHVAIVMDGNGRWAKQKGHARHEGHKAVAINLRSIVKYCSEKGIEVLTVFAFSSENWKRPKKEVSLLMELFMDSLKREAKLLKEHNIRMRIIGDRSAFSARLQRQMAETEAVTEECTGMVFQIAANYGGRWDIVQAVQGLAEQVRQGLLSPDQLDEEAITRNLVFADQPDPDLFIRTGGEKRLSNFVLWQSAYSELYFSPAFWPDFNEQEMAVALQEYAGRQRRFGMTGEQVQSNGDAKAC